MLTKSFKGGVVLREFKELTAEKSIKAIPAPSHVILPLSQHTGSPAKPIVKPGDEVKMGQSVGQSDAFISAPVHSPVSGKVKAVINFLNPIYGRGPAVTIENDNRYEPFPAETKDPKALSKEELIRAIRDAGIVGLGGASFPTHVKLSVPKGKTIDTLIVNGAECEPYLTCDHRLMAEKADEIIKGINIVAKILNARNIFIAIEENKPDAVLAVKKTLGRTEEKSPAPAIEIAILKTKYPQGGEKQLIKVILGREVPSGGLPLDVGAVVQNVGTCLAISEAIYKGKPLIERCITLTGSCLKEPGNYTVCFGTLLEDAVKHCGGFKKPPAKIIVGGPMMGIAQYTTQIPVVKGISGIVFLPKEEISRTIESVCIRCGKCVEICPMRLMPTTLMNYVKKERFGDAKNSGIANCFECGACAYICPAKIPLLDYMKFGKSKIQNL